MTCDQIRPLLSSYHDEVLSMEERAWVRMHVATCPACSSILDTYEEMFAALRRTPAPVPADLRRNVYNRIAEIEARSGGRLPFSPNLLGALRTAGGTAGLLAVLAALVAAALRLSEAPFSANVAIGPSRTAQAALHLETTALASTLGAQLIDSLPAQPPAVQTAIAPLKRNVDRGDAVRVDGVDGRRSTASKVKLKFSLVPHGLVSGQKANIVPGELTLSFTSRTPRAGSVAYSTPSPVPTLPPDSGLVYLHLSDDNPFFAGRGNARWADLEFQSFAQDSRPRVLATPVAQAQLFTGVNAAKGGNTIIFSAMSQDPRLGGLFQLGPAIGGSEQLLALADFNPPNHYPKHRYIQQAYPTLSGRLMISFVQNSASGLASVAITVSRTLQGSLRQIVPIYWPLYNVAVSPDQRSIAWTHRADAQGFGELQVASPGAQPVTRTIAQRSSHPVWSPDGTYLLYLHQTAANTPAGIWLWSRQDGSTRELVPPDADDGSSITGMSWAPDGRFFAFIRTITGPRGYGQVWLGDTQTGVLWKSFTRRFIGSAAWVRATAVPAQPANPTPTATAVPPAPATPTPTPAPPTPATVAPRPAPYALDDGPLDVLRSFHNALNRQEYGRAYSYLAFNDGRSVAMFEKGYADTKADKITRLVPPRYFFNAGNYIRTCVGFQMVAYQRSGVSAVYGGWYGVEAQMNGSGKPINWRIDTRASSLTKDDPPRVLSQAACQAQPWSSTAAPSPTATAAP